MNRGCRLVELTFVHVVILSKFFLKIINVSAANKRQHGSKVFVIHHRTSFFDDLNTSRNLVLWENESPLSVRGFKGTNPNVRFVQFVKQVAQFQRCILCITHLHIHARYSGNTGDALDVGFYFNIRANDGFQTVFLVASQVPNLNGDAHCVHRFHSRWMENRGVSV